MDLRKRKQSRRPLHYLLLAFKTAVFGIFFIATLILLNQLNWPHHFPIKTVRVYGIAHVDKNEVQTLLQPVVSQGFFNINVEYVRDRLLQLPWVSDLYVRRLWPDQLEITLVEKEAVAKWNEASLLSQAGELFTPKADTYPAILAHFVGPSGKQIVMLQYFNEMNRLLAALHVKIAYLELTPYFTWKLTLDNGITLQIGHKDILTRLSHFVKVYPKIVGDRAAYVDYIDLRYANGVAVRYRNTIKT